MSKLTFKAKSSLDIVKANGASQFATLLNDAHTIVANQLALMKSRSGTQQLAPEDIQSLHKLIQSAQILEQAVNKQYDKLDKAFENLTPEEQAVIEHEARKLLAK